MVVMGAGCAHEEHTADAEQAIYRSNTSTDTSWWTHDDEDGPDSVYATFSTQAFATADDAGVFVDVPNCSPSDTFIAHFNGIAAGEFEYRASLRMVVQHAGSSFPIHGAQVYLPPINDVMPFHLTGVFTVPSNGPCRISLSGKSFTRSLELIGGASLIVQRLR
jgi:hypothetical protein